MRYSNTYVTIVKADFARKSPWRKRDHPQVLFSSESAEKVRDDFTPRTIETLAKRAGYLCSNVQMPHLGSGAEFTGN